MQSNRIAFKAEHNKYRAMLQSIRKSTLSDRVKECEQDTKKLYAFVNGIIGRSSENPMPEVMVINSLLKNLQITSWQR